MEDNEWRQDGRNDHRDKNSSVGEYKSHRQSQHDRAADESDISENCGPRLGC
jgi:hypothetical protein